MKTAAPEDVASTLCLSILWIEKVLNLEFRERQQISKGTVEMVLTDAVRLLEQYRARTVKEIELRW
jgi:hypothetical protein